MGNTRSAASRSAAEPGFWVQLGQEWQVAYWARRCGVSRDQLAVATQSASPHDIPVAEWVDRCALRLGVLQRYMSPVQALARAIELHEDRYHIPPETAAELEFSDWPRHHA